jgi:hypothetical protein
MQQWLTSGKDFQVIFRPVADPLSRCFCRGNTRGGDPCSDRSLQRCDVVSSRVLDADKRDGSHSGSRKRIPAPTADQQTLMPPKNRQTPRTRWQPRRPLQHRLSKN